MLKHSVVAFIAVVAVLLAMTAGAQTVTVGSVSVRCGESVDVPVTISAVSGLLSIQFDVTYDSSKLQPTQVTSGALTSGFSLASNITSTQIKIAMASGSPVSGSGRVATIRFTAGSAATGTSSLPISGILVNDVAKGGVNGTATITCPQPPTAPTLVSPSDGATNVAAPVTLRWNASSGADAYLVYFGTPSPSAMGSTPSTSMQVDTATGTAYEWYVRARNDAGTSAPSPTWSFTTSGSLCVTPNAPQINAPAAVSSGVAYAVSWTAVSNASEYVLDEAGNASFTGATSTTTTATSLSFTKSVNAPTTFYYRVRAHNTNGGCNATSPASNTAAVVASPRPPIPPGGAVLIVVGTSPGALGAMFRTAIQLHNPTGGVLRGKIVFHAAGTSGRDSDPSLPYEIQPWRTFSHSDFLPAMGITSGLGSADIVPDGGNRLPLLVTRIFNDAGAEGTSGMTLEVLGLDDALFSGQTGVIIAPVEPARTRMNIGIRALVEGVSMTVRMRDRTGAVVATKDISYPPVYFLQTPAEILIGVPLVGDAALAFTVNSGSAMVYGSTTDNKTQDPNIQIARPIE